MAVLTLIGDPFPDWEAEAQSAAIRDLTAAVADTAPKSCSARYLLSRGGEAPTFDSPLVRVDRLGLPATSLPVIWQGGITARPLDGEFVHALTPLVPLRSRGDDGSQTSVTVPHTVAWEAPELLGSTYARLYRAYTKRAIRLADVLITPTHAAARVLQERYGEGLPVQVLPLAPPAEFRKQPNHRERLSDLGLDGPYLATTAMPGDYGRLEWVFDALRAHPEIPRLVILGGVDPLPPLGKGVEGAAFLSGTIPADLQDRIVCLNPEQLSDVGAVIAGARLLLQPQSYTGTGYTILAALAAGVPVLHSGHAAAAELVLDGGVQAEASDTFAGELGRLMGDDPALACLGVLALDRSRGYSWRSTAWQLWEIHANI